MPKLNKDDLWVIIVLMTMVFMLYIALQLGAGRMETNYLIAEMGEETYEEIKTTLTMIGEKPTNAKIANYYVEYYK